MLTKAKITILVSAGLAILGTFLPGWDLAGWNDVIVKIVMALLPLFGGAAAFYLKSEPTKTLERWVDGLS